MNVSLSRRIVIRAITMGYSITNFFPIDPAVRVHLLVHINHVWYHFELQSACSGEILKIGSQKPVNSYQEFTSSRAIPKSFSDGSSDLPVINRCSKLHAVMVYGTFCYEKRSLDCGGEFLVTVDRFLIKLGSLSFFKFAVPLPSLAPVSVPDILVG